MKLRTNEIRRFFQNANGIKYGNGILPVLQYVKVANDKMIKTNLNAYVIQDITPVGETFLLHEGILSAFLKDCRSDEFEVKIDGNVVWLLEGKRKMKFQFSEANIYPETPEIKKDASIRIEESILKQVGIASKNIGNQEKPALDFVHISNGMLIGGNNYCYYFYKAEGCPDLLISAACASAIYQYGGVNFYKHGRYDFYEVGSILYGFIQTEHKTPDFTPFLPNAKPKEYLEVDVAECIGFCETVISGSSNRAFDASFNGNKLSFYDADIDFEYEIELETTGTYSPSINFNPKLLSSFLKALPYDYIQITKSKVNPASLDLWNADDDAFYGLFFGTIID